MTLLADPSTPLKTAEPQQGVIEDARRRRDVRRARFLAALVAAMLLGAGIWAFLAGGSHASSSVAEHPTRGQGVSVGTRPGFNIRVWPTLTVGRAGWCMVVEEHKRAGVSACGGPAQVASPFVETFGVGPAGGPSSMTMFAVTGPQVAAVLVDGHLRRATTSLPGLPYGMRAARISNVPPGMTIVPLDQRGHVVPHGSSPFPPKQAAIRSWRYPYSPPRGACELATSGLPAHAVRAGTVATALWPFPGQLVGHAFVPCIATEYQLRSTPLKAIFLLDAAQPSVRAAALPNFHAVRGEPGIYAEGSLTATRSGLGWLIVEQGRTPAERVTLLKHLTATTTTSS